MSTNTYKSGTERLRNRSLSRRQWERIYANRYLFDSSANNNNKLQEKPDTIERKKIHDRIMKLVEENKNKTEIVSILISEFPESNLRKFFDSYAQHHIDKKNKSVGEGR